MAGILSELRFATRMLLKNPGFSGISILILVLGIGANTAIFSIINALLLRPLPYRDPGQLVLLWEDAPQFGFDFVPTSEGGFVAWRDRNQVFSSMALFSTTNFTLTGMGEAERLQGTESSWELFQVLGVEPELGRVFTEADEGRQGGEPSVILTHGFWMDHFSGRSDVVGTRLVLNGTPRTVIGVLPEDFFFPPPVEVLNQLSSWRPQLYIPVVPDPESMGSRGSFVIARLKPGLNIEQAQQGLAAVAATLTRDFPGNYPDGTGAILAPLHGQAVSGSRRALMVLLGAVAFILLIACLNVANLLLARGTARQREISVRIALGASRGRILRQLLVESLLLALLAALGGLAVARFGLALLLRIGEGMLPDLGPVGIDPGVLGFTFLTALATAVVFGLAPALQLSRPNLHETLKEGGRGNSAGLGRQSLRKLLIVGEVALALTLLVGAGLLISSFWRVQQVDLGFVSENLVSFDTYLRGKEYDESNIRNLFYERLISQVSSIPGVLSAAAIDSLPLSQSRSATGYLVEGQEAPDPSQQVQITDRRQVSPNYFQTMRIPILEGRGILASDREDSEPVMVINQTLARRHFPKESPIGKRISIGNDAPGNHRWRRIVGVAANIKHSRLTSESQAAVYLPLAGTPPNHVALVVRSHLDVEQITRQVRALLAGIDRNVALRVDTMESLVREAQSNFRAPAILLAIFAGLALLLAVVGLYGVLSFLVSQRTQEIGVRMALGASTGKVVVLILRQIGLLVGAGVLIGLLGGYACSKWMTSLLYQTSPGDPGSLTAAALIFFLVAAVAGLVPALRAARTDPLTALRVE